MMGQAGRPSSHYLLYLLYLLYSALLSCLVLSVFSEFNVEEIMRKFLSPSREQ